MPNKRKNTETATKGIECTKPNGCGYSSCANMGKCMFASLTPDSTPILNEVLETPTVEASETVQEIVSVVPQPIPDEPAFTDPETVSLPNTLHVHRESWLHDVAGRLSDKLFSPKFEVPGNIRISCGFPSKNGLMGNKTIRLGECWGESKSKDGHFEIFISPTIDNPFRVVGVLAHEMCHAVAGIEAKHGPLFRDVATHIGLEGKMSNTTESEAFQKVAIDIVEAIGPYPMAQLEVAKMTNGRKKQSTRLLKATCLQCNYTVRISNKWVEEVGNPHCPNHGEMTMDSQLFDPDISE